MPSALLSADGLPHSSLPKRTVIDTTTNYMQWAEGTKGEEETDLPALGEEEDTLSLDDPEAYYDDFFWEADPSEKESEHHNPERGP